MNLAPIVLFVYNRLDITQQTVEALSNNVYAAESDLIIFSDGPKNNVDERKVTGVRNYVKNITGFKTVTISYRDNNLGLANSITAGVTEIVNKYGKIIVLEDDLITSHYFLKFMNEGLNKFEDNEEVASINGYILPITGLPEIFFLKYADCLGWATWQRAWRLFERDVCKLLVNIRNRKSLGEFNFGFTYPYFDMLRGQAIGQNDSWAVKWYASVFVNNRVSLFPGKSLVFHNGKGLTATNAGNLDWLDVKLSNDPIDIVKIPISENVVVRKRVEEFNRSVQTKIWYKLIIYQLLLHDYIPVFVIKLYKLYTKLRYSR